MTEQNSGLNERLISNTSYNDELTAESALRPTNLTDFVGQKRVKEQLGLVLAAAAGRNSNPDHILLAGPPGLGKTTLAMIIANEINSPLRITSGPTVVHAGDLASILSSLVPGEVLFIDEIHRMSRAAQELLYVAMEDFRVDVMVGKGPGATSIPLELPAFTLVGATTRSGLLPAPLRDRFGFTAHLDFYEQSELVAILHRSAKQLDIEIDDQSATELAKRSRGTPRIANRLLRRVRDYGQVHHFGKLSLLSTKAALELYEVDDLGLDRLDRAVLAALIDNFNGGPVGLSTLALAVGEEPETIDFVCEPFLVRNGFLVRTPRGRQATAVAYQALGRKIPPGANLQIDFEDPNL